MTVVAFLVFGFVYPNETYDPPATRITGPNALSICLTQAEQLLRAAERQMPPGSKAYASCRIER